ncbi:hypothetical protein BDV96DRAFT_603242 [Lophiotrema nucula]|uniref:Uncharacterized protein n=1 Tax=Lophiotrema nucula TaxID=690887 RepID=A0A6A5YVM3_9PLEO|nr:hypothetical protein BDV96DRAFT_603242 [Lophiotrema nucula]
MTRVKKLLEPGSDSANKYMRSNSASYMQRFIVPYSKLAVHEITSNMYLHLPREVCDMIYEYLWKICDLRHLGLLIRKRNAPSLPEYGERSWCIRDRRRFKQSCAFVVHPAYVGNETASELLEIVYQRTQTRYRRPERAPVTRTLRTRCRIDRYVILGRGDLSPGPLAHQDRLKRDFNSLLDGVDKDGFVLEIEFLYRIVRLKVLWEVLRIARSVFEKLEANGAKVVVLLDYAPTKDNGICHYCVGHQSITLDMIKKQGVLEKQNESIVERHREYRRENDVAYNPNNYFRGMRTPTTRVIGSSHRHDVSELELWRCRALGGEFNLNGNAELRLGSRSSTRSVARGHATAKMMKEQKNGSLFCPQF